jgi:hypothetical protein
VGKLDELAGLFKVSRSHLCDEVLAVAVEEGRAGGVVRERLGELIDRVGRGRSSMLGSDGVGGASWSWPPFGQDVPQRPIIALMFVSPVILLEE